MNDPENEDRLSDDLLGQALTDALPTLRRIKFNGWAIIAGLVVFTAAVTYGLWTSDVSRKMPVFSVIFGIAAVVFAAASVRSQHERKVMPILARTFGLRYDKSLPSFYRDLPSQFIPAGTRQSCDDVMSGRVADRNFQFAEITTEAGGKNRTVLFKGVVIGVTTRKAMPALRILPISETTGWLMAKSQIDVDGIVKVFSAPGPGQDFGLWVEQAQDTDTPGLHELMESMMTLAETLANGRLFAVACTSSAIYVAISRQSEMFTIGGLLASDLTIMEDIGRASVEFGEPMRLTIEVLRIEDAWIVAMDGKISTAAS